MVTKRQFRSANFNAWSQFVDFSLKRAAQQEPTRIKIEVRRAPDRFEVVELRGKITGLIHTSGSFEECVAFVRSMPEGFPFYYPVGEHVTPDLARFEFSTSPVTGHQRAAWLAEQSGA